MEQKNKKIIAIAIIALVILAGIVVVGIWGFNKELKYLPGQSIDIYLEQQVDVEKIKEIASENLGMHNMVQTVEIYQDMVTIRAKSITEEQKNNIVSKIKETYESAQEAENVVIKTVPETRIRDMYKQYVLPFMIAGILVTAYVTIRYYKKGILKTLGKIIIIPIIAELLLISWIAIVRIPVGRFVPILIILMYIASVLYVINENER